eukprot:6583248-Prymnesium_polylepis.2
MISSSGFPANLLSVRLDDVSAYKQKTNAGGAPANRAFTTELGARLAPPMARCGGVGDRVLSER